MPKVTRRLIKPYLSTATCGLFLTSGKEFIADIKLDDGKRIRRNFGADKTRAFALYDALTVEIENKQEERENPLVTAFLTETFLPSQSHLKAYDYAETRIKAVCRFLNERYSRLRIADVRKHHCVALMDYYAEQSPRTINGNVQKFKQAMNHAVDLELLPANPLARVKGMKFDNRRMETCSVEDFVRIVRESQHTDVQGVFLICGLTGLRPNNVLNLRKEYVVGDVARIPPQLMKNGRWGLIPLSGYVQDYLKSIGKPTLFFPSRSNADAPKNRHNVRRAWESVVGRLGLEHLRLYDLRHFYASELAAQGATEQQIGRLLCHVGQSVTSRYVHQDIETIRPFVERLSERFVDSFGSVPKVS